MVVEEVKREKKREKKEKPKSVVKPNTLRKALLGKIKEYQKEQEITNIQTPIVKDFQDEFDKSLNYLQDLSKKKRKQKKRTNKNQTVKISSPMVDVELPAELRETKLHVTNDDKPYGCLKNGTKPTYRTWKRLTQKGYEPKPKIQISNPPKIKEPSLREKKLETIKTQFSEKQSTPKYLLKRKTTTRKYKLGKSGKHVSILIKNRHTRKKIQHEMSLLKKKSITDVKNYLRKRGLLKAGSDAPNDVLRQMYEQAILSGEVRNTGKDILLHNFLNP